MQWQDLAITVASIVMSFSLIPAIRDSQKPPLKTSIPTTVGLDVIALSFLSLGLYLSFAITEITATLWLILAMQRTKQNAVDNALNEWHGEVYE